MAEKEYLLDLLGLSSVDQIDDGLEVEAPAQSAEEVGRRSAGKKKKEAIEEDEEEVVPFYRVKQAGPNPNDDPEPVAFVPPENFLKDDAQDQYIPRNSFIGDFVYNLKGYESPVLFNIWGAIYSVAVMSGRQSWFKFGAGKIFPNLYLIWVAKPGVCKKGTALGLATDLLQELPAQYNDDPFMREERSIDYISSKAPADAIFMSLKPKVRTFILPDGSVHQANFGSRTYVSATELATFLNTKKFNTGLVDTLTDLFDCKERDRELTRGRGVENYEKFFFCLGGACTPMHMETSFPPEARGGGFMSRCILIHQEFPSVWHSIPEVYKGFPTKEGLLSNLKWLSYKTRGEYYFTEEALVEYNKWYYAWRASLFSRGVQDDALAETRMDILTIKVATIIRMAEYRRGFDVTLENYLAARKLISYTLSHSNNVASGLGAKEKRVNYTKVRSILQKKRSMVRKKLLPNLSARGIFVQELGPILGQLQQEGYLKITLDGRDRYAPGIEGRELYEWIGPTEDEEYAIGARAVESSPEPEADDVEESV